MSNPLAIGAVSAVLRNLLDDGVVGAVPGLGSVQVTAVAPDQVATDDGDPASINLYLHRVTPNPGWRGAELPAFDSAGRRVAAPPLALDLHYLVTAYGTADFEAEILLGYAMHLLHERPVLDRATVRRALDPSPLGAGVLPASFQALRAADLADQVEQLTISQEPLDTEEMSRLWSAFQTNHRPTVGYVVTVVLIESTVPTRDALPVLTRGEVDPVTGDERGVVVEASLLPALPTVLRLVPPDGEPAVVLGETVRVEGHHLAGTGVEVDLEHRFADDVRTVVVGTVSDPTGFDLPLPTSPGADADWPAGLWRVTVRLVPDGTSAERRSNAAGLLLAPEPAVATASVSRDGTTGRVTVDLDVHPLVQPGQPVTLALGSDVADAAPVTTATGTLGFSFGVLPSGPQWARLRVDGAESRLVDRSTSPPGYDATQVVAVPT